MTTESKGYAASAWAIAVVIIICVIMSVSVVITGLRGGGGLMVLGGIVAAIASFALCGGFFTLQPNEAAVILLFGKYKGTDNEEGWRWTNPFASTMKVSLRARNLNIEKLKVNDKSGNPIEIAAVVIWRITDTVKACFDVDDCARYVTLQSESALRHLATSYSYDHEDEKSVSLRGNTEVVIEALKKELQDRLAKAGVEVEDARITHLAYAPEIAGAMLKRQQAEAVIAARSKIVTGAVSMVEMALNELSARKVVELDAERKAAMVSNLLVVLCAENEAQPVINAGTLY